MLKYKIDILEELKDIKKKLLKQAKKRKRIYFL